MYCKNCEKEINDNAVICPECGVATANASTNSQQTQDNGGFLWGLLGCCIPLVGLILFLVWRDTKPKTSKAAGIGALVSVSSVVLLYALSFALGMGTLALGW